jgi:hypothetical protein
VPAATVLVGFLLLAPMLGIPLSWWRLSVIGNTAYEIMAANIALSAAGQSGLSPQAAAGSGFILVMYVMAIGIMGSMLLAPMLAKRIHLGTFRFGEEDRGRRALQGSTYMAAMLIVFVVPIFLGLSSALLTLLTSAALMAFLRWLARTLHIAWLSGFIFTISTFTAIVLSVFWQHLFV